MRHDSIHSFHMDDEERFIASQSDFHEGSSSVEGTGESVLKALSISELTEQCRQEINSYRDGISSTDVSSVELLRRATVQSDQEARACWQWCLTEIVHGWLYRHPYREMATRLESEENYVFRAFERFWQTSTRSQQVEFRALADALRYLCVSLNGVLLDALRAYERPEEARLPEAGESRAESHREGHELWETIRSLLPDQKEQRLAYLLFHCGLGPREIVHICPGEFSSVQDIYHLRRNIIKRLYRYLEN